MKTLTIELPDDVCERAERRAAERGSSLRIEVIEHVSRLGIEEGDDVLEGARRRMRELFQTIKGFRSSPKITREELYDR